MKRATAQSVDSAHGPSAGSDTGTLATRTRNMQTILNVTLILGAYTLHKVFG